MAARICARYLSYDNLMDDYRRCRDRCCDPEMAPLPDSLHDKIFLNVIQKCFPENEDDIRLYSCLANGNADEFSRGEALFQKDAVQEVIQIGYHVSAFVTSSVECDDNGGHSVRQSRIRHCVSATIDRCRIVSITCSCSLKSQWCQHAVAVCLFRIHKSDQVEFRVTISDSVNELSQSQLRKFAQYLVHQLPRQYLPVAQKLIDNLRDPLSEISQTDGAPDSTDGGHEEVAIWALDQHGLRDNIRRILIKFCVPTPQVHCDVHHLSSTQPPIASEWQSLLQPLKRTEPKGLWNLLSIVREMYSRRDENATTLLHIITEECLANSQVLMWWYMTKLVQTGKWCMFSPTKGSGYLSNQHSAQYNCAQLCDEVVRLWRSAALNPRLTSFERQQLSGFLQFYHRTACERIFAGIGTASQLAESIPAHQQHPSGLIISSMMEESGARLGPENARFTRTMFPGFFEALEACQVSWHDVYMEGVECGDRDFVGAMSHGLSVDVDLPDAPCCSASPNMPFLSNHGHTMPKAYDPPTTSSSFALPFYSIDLSHLQSQHKKRKKRRNARGHAHGNARGASDPYLPEFFDARSLRHAAREAARRAARQQQAAQEESTESGQESDFPPPGVVGQLAQERAADGLVGHGSSVQSQPSGPVFPAEDVDLVLASAHETIDGMELKFARCEALQTHGYLRLAGERASELMLAMSQQSPNLTASPSILQETIRHNERVHAEEKAKADERNWDLKRRHRQAAVTAAPSKLVTPSNCCYSKLLQISHKTVRHLERALFLAKTMLSNSKCHEQVFRFVLHVLELPKTPMANRYLQVKLFHLEHELVEVLRSIEVGPEELKLVRERAKILASTAAKALVPPVILAHFILDSLTYTTNMFPNGVTSGTSTGRQIGREPYDDELALCAALETLGAKQIFGENDFPMLSESIRRQRGDMAVALLASHKDSNEKLGLILDKLLDPSVHRMYKSHQSNAAYFLEHDPVYQKHCIKGARPKYPYKSEAMEPTTSCASTVQRMNSVQSASSASSECQSIDEEAEQITRKMGGISTRFSDDGGDSISLSTRGSTRNSSPDQSASSSQVAEISEGGEPITNFDLGYYKKRKQMNTLLGGGLRASEAAAHYFYTELTKNVLNEAGGTQPTVVFNASNQNQQQGSHRKLQIAAFMIGVYALGVNNQVNNSWPTRTYSGHVSWVTGQTQEIGVPALEIIRDTWPAHLTPTEVAALADKASQSREAAVVEKAAELALSVLPSAYALTAAESQRALHQCREQSVQMVEQACRAIEQAAEKDGVYPEVLFTVARLWAELHAENEGPMNASAVVNAYSANSPYSAISQGPYGQQYMVPTGFDPSVASGYFGYHPAMPPPPMGHYHNIHHRPHSVYMQPGNMQYVANLSVNHGQHQHENRLPTSIHQSHSAPNLIPSGQQANVSRKELQQPSSSTYLPLSGDPRVYRLVNAHRVGMRALETMGHRLIDDTRGYTKFSQKPPYGEDIKWLLKISWNLGPMYLLSFYEGVTRALVSPFLLQDLAVESTGIFTRGNYPPISLATGQLNQNQPINPKCINTYRSQIRSSMANGGYHAVTGELMEKAVDSYYQAIYYKMNHPRFMPGDVDDVSQLVRKARDGMLWIPNIGKLVFEDFVRHVKKQKGYRKEMIAELNKIVQGGH